MTKPVQIPDAAVQALEALKKAEMFIENGVEYGFIRLPEKDDPALDTLPKIKDAIEVLTNEGAKPVDVAAVRGQELDKSTILEVLDECESYFENRSDAGHDDDGFIPNKEMILLNSVRDVIRALSAEPAQGEQWRPTHRHVKRGTEYQLIDIGIFQAGNWKVHYETIGYKDADMQQVAIYRGEDGQLWARPILEFNDGRFEPIPAAPTPEAKA